MKPTCLITGSSGSIGSSLAHKFSQEGFLVLGVDQVLPNHTFCLHTFACDINEVVNSSSARKVFCSSVLDHSLISNLSLIINCAAFQPLVDFTLSDVDLYQKALSVNTVFPLLLYRLLYPPLKSNSGVLINIGSIHSSLSKSTFALYASSKAALRSLTHSLAIENRGEILTYLIEPAAIDTPLLREGFTDSVFSLDDLKNCHPSGSIGLPADVSEVAWFLYRSRILFLHGTTIDLSGGIKHVLHDPQSF